MSLKRPQPHLSSPPNPPPTTRKVDLTHADLQRQAEAQAILSNREYLIWTANARQDSLAQTELHYTKLLHRPHENPPRGLRPLYKNAMYGDKMPDGLVEKMREEDEAARRRVQVGKGKQREGDHVKREEAKKYTGDRMDVDDEEEEEEEEGEDGGVAIGDGEEDVVLFRSRERGANVARSGQQHGRR